MKIKEQAKKVLKRNNIDFIDFGTYNYRDCDYNEYVKQACKAIEDKTCDFGIGFCRTGQGVNILANHMNNIRSALLIDGYTAEHSIRHNCANFFAIPEKYVSESELEAIIEKLKTSSFDGGRHMTRMKKTIGVKR
jgi:ribose 5-phosphate isomerase B